MGKKVVLDKESHKIMRDTITDDVDSVSSVSTVPSTNVNLVFW